MSERSAMPPNIVEMLRDLRAGNPFEKAARIGIVGGSRAGKSVLLTSLLDHLRHFDTRRFRLLEGGLFQRNVLDLRDFTEETLPEPPTRFPYEAFRAQLTEAATWPRKTRDAYQIRVRMTANAGPFGLRVPMLLTFLDFPGERFADAAMAGRSFDEWSEIMERTLLSGAGHGAAISAFRKARIDPEATVESVASAYRRLLAVMISDYRIFISPSTFALGPEGDSPPRGAPPEDLAATRLSGLDSARPFAPLDSVERRRHPEITRVYTENYDAYRNVLVEPLFAALKRCDRLAFLANIPEILQSGVGALNDTADLLQNVLDGCSAASGLISRSARVLANRVLPLLLRDEWRPGGVNRVALVATQADRIHPSDIDRLKHLLRELASPVVRNAGNAARLEFLTCAAVRATETREDRLRGIPAVEWGAEPRSREPREYEVSRLPAAWPDNWDPAEYSFEDVLPRFSPNRRRPPAQAGLDTLFQFLLP